MCGSNGRIISAVLGEGGRQWLKEGTSCCIVLCRVVSCRLVSCYVMFGRVVSCRGIPKDLHPVSAHSNKPATAVQCSPPHPPRA